MKIPEKVMFSVDKPIKSFWLCHSAYTSGLFVRPCDKSRKEILTHWFDRNFIMTCYGMCLNLEGDEFKKMSDDEIVKYVSRFGIDISFINYESIDHTKTPSKIIDVITGEDLNAKKEDKVL